MSDEKHSKKRDYHSEVENEGYTRLFFCQYKGEVQ
jgi:hypothetical protein